MADNTNVRVGEISTKQLSLRILLEEFRNNPKSVIEIMVNEVPQFISVSQLINHFLHPRSRLDLYKLNGDKILYFPSYALEDSKQINYRKSIANGVLLGLGNEEQESEKVGQEPHIQYLTLLQRYNSLIRNEFEMDAQLDTQFQELVFKRLSDHFAGVAVLNDELVVELLSKGFDIVSNLNTNLIYAMTSKEQPKEVLKFEDCANIIEKLIGLNKSEKCLSINLGTTRDPNERKLAEIPRLFERYKGNPEMLKKILKSILKIPDTGGLDALKGEIRKLPKMGTKARPKKEAPDRESEKNPLQTFTAPYIRVLGQQDGGLRSSIREAMPLITSLESALMQTGIEAIRQFSEGPLKQQFELVYPTSVKFSNNQRDLGIALVEAQLSGVRSLESHELVDGPNEGVQSVANGVQSVLNIIKAKEKINKSLGLPTQVATKATPLEINKLFDDEAVVTASERAISNQEIEYLKQVKRVRQYHQIMRNIAFYLGIGKLNDELSTSIYETILDILKDKSPTLKLSIFKKKPTLGELSEIIAKNPLTFQELDYIRNNVLRETAYKKDSASAKCLINFDLNAKKLTEVEFDNPLDALNRPFYARTVRKAINAEENGFVIVEPSQTQKGEKGLNAEDDDYIEQSYNSDDGIDQIIYTYGQPSGIPALNITQSPNGSNRSPNGNSSTRTIAEDSPENNTPTSPIIELSEEEDELTAKELVELYFNVGEQEKPQIETPAPQQQPAKDKPTPYTPDEFEPEAFVVAIPTQLPEPIPQPVPEEQIIEILPQETVTLPDFADQWLLNPENVSSFRNEVVLNRIKIALAKLKENIDQRDHADINDLIGLLTDKTTTNKDFLELYLLEVSNVIGFLQSKSYTTWFRESFSDLDTSNLVQTIQKIQNNQPQLQDLEEFTALHNTLISKLPGIPIPFSLRKNEFLGGEQIENITTSLLNNLHSPQQILEFLNGSVSNFTQIKYKEVKNATELIEFNKILEVIGQVYGEKLSVTDLILQPGEGVSVKNTNQMIVSDRLEGLGRLDLVIEIVNKVGANLSQVIDRLNQEYATRQEQLKRENEQQNQTDLSTQNLEEPAQQLDWSIKQSLEKLDLVYKKFINNNPNVEQSLDLVYQIAIKWLSTDKNSSFVSSAFNQLKNTKGVDKPYFETLFSQATAQQFSISTINSDQIWNSNYQATNIAIVSEILTGSPDTKLIKQRYVEPVYALDALFREYRSNEGKSIAGLKRIFTNQLQTKEQLLKIFQAGSIMNLLSIINESHKINQIADAVNEIRKIGGMVKYVSDKAKKMDLGNHSNVSKLLDGSIPKLTQEQARYWKAQGDMLVDWISRVYVVVTYRHWDNQPTQIVSKDTWNNTINNIVANFDVKKLSVVTDKFGPPPFYLSSKSINLDTDPTSEDYIALFELMSFILQNLPSELLKEGFGLSEAGKLELNRRLGNISNTATTAFDANYKVLPSNITKFETLPINDLVKIKTNLPNARRMVHDARTNITQADFVNGNPVNVYEMAFLLKLIFEGSGPSNFVALPLEIRKDVLKIVRQIATQDPELSAFLAHTFAPERPVVSPEYLNNSNSRFKPAMKIILNILEQILDHHLKLEIPSANTHLLQLTLTHEGRLEVVKNSLELVEIFESYYQGLTPQEKDSLNTNHKINPEYFDWAKNNCNSILDEPNIYNAVRYFETITYESIRLLLQLYPKYSIGQIDSDLVERIQNSSYQELLTRHNSEGPSLANSLIFKIYQDHYFIPNSDNNTATLNTKRIIFASPEMLFRIISFSYPAIIDKIPKPQLRTDAISNNQAPDNESTSQNIPESF